LNFVRALLCPGPARTARDPLAAVRSTSRNPEWHVGGRDGPRWAGSLTQKRPVRKD
jgi:hypothetical protein